MQSTLNLFLCLSAITSSCHGSASSDIATLQKDFFAWQVSENPIQATTSDVHKYNDQVESFRMEKIDERKAAADQFYKRLKAIPENELSQKDTINYKILDDMLNTFIEGYKWRFFQSLSSVNFLEGPQLYIENLVQDLPFYTRGDFENYIARLELFPQQYEERKKLMEEGIRLNRTYHRHSMSRLQKQFERLQVPANQSEFYWPFRNKLDNSTFKEDVREDLRLRGMAAVTEVLSALGGLWEFIREEYMPNTRPEISISSLDGGREYYAACIRWYLSENRTAQEVHDIGLREVDRITKNMQNLMAKEGYQGTVGEYFRGLMNDSNSFFKTKDELIEQFRHQIFDVIDPKMDAYFSNNPRLPLEVRSTPTDSTAGYYTLGSSDGARPGIFWLNGHRPNDYANFTMMALSIHETYPGHHLQLSVSLLSDTPDFRQKMLWTELYHVPFAFPDYAAYVEGWAMYSEFLGEEMGLYRDNLELMGRYSSEIFRACRLVVDTGIHAFNWTRKEAIDYFLNYTAETPASIALEIDRYITWPGQALAYKIGEIKIKELRKKAERQLGKRFDIQEFHSVVLDSGSVPLSVLEDLVDSWLDSYPAPPSEPDTRPVTCGGAGILPAYLGIFLISLGYIL